MWQATTPITSRYEGTITKLYYEEGEQAQTGLPLLDIEVDDGEADAGGDAPSEAAVEAPAAEAVSSGGPSHQPTVPALPSTHTHTHTHTLPPHQGAVLSIIES